MRKFVNVSKSKQLELQSQFNGIMKLYCCEENDIFNQVSISVFDHFLSRKEAINEIDEASSQVEIENNQKLHEFCIELAASTECYLVKLKGRGKEVVTFKEFISENGLINTLVPKHHLISDSFRFVLILPQFNAVYFEGCDFTHHLYYKGKEISPVIIKLIKNHGVYILK